ncbi:MAG: hypothetical protein KKA79_00565 [Nanoarchaeota archaeon]|nr:hypothetical protein [Nanoarchaeota archaeon]MCG2717665.1 hypothetical protein [Nanoarchaeota archaeon]
MSKEYPLPCSNTKTAKERLEEITKDEDVKITKYTILGSEHYYYESFDGECRVYDDGFEARYGRAMKAFLHVKEGSLNGVLITYKFRRPEEED